MVMMNRWLKVAEGNSSGLKQNIVRKLKTLD